MTRHVVWKEGQGFYRRKEPLKDLDDYGISASTVLQNALTALETADGAKITLEKGTYDLSTTGLVINAEKATIIDFQNSKIQYSGTGKAIEIKTTSASSVIKLTMQNLELELNNASAIGIQLTPAGESQYINKPRIENVKITGTYNKGIVVKSYVHHGKFEQIDAIGTCDYGFYIETNANINWFVECSVGTSKAGGVGFYHAGQDCVFLDCDVEGVDTAFDIHGTRNIFAFNHVEGGASTDWAFDADTSAGRGNCYLWNTITVCSRSYSYKYYSEDFILARGYSEEPTMLLQNIPTPMDLEYIPAITRMNNDALDYFDDPYFVSRVHTTPVEQYASWLWPRQFGYGTYEWIGKVSNTNYGGQLFGFEHHHGWMNEGIADFHIRNGNLWTRTSWNGSVTDVDRGAWTYGTNEVTFKIVWSSTQIDFYIDGVLKGTHTTNIPQDLLSFFIECYALTGCTIEPIVYLKKNTLKKLA